MERVQQEPVVDLTTPLCHLVVCFDLDGCLVDSYAAITTCINHALEVHGMPTLPPEQLTPLIGPPLEEGMTDLVHDLLGDPAIVPALIATYRERYRDLALTITTRIPGMRAVLRSADDWATVGVVTSKPMAFAVPIVDAVGMRRLVSFVEGPAVGREIEPKQVTLARALERWGDGDGVVMVGDRRHDIAAAHANGAIGIGVTWGSGSRDELQTAGADHIVDSPEELPDLLRSIGRGPGG